MRVASGETLLTNLRAFMVWADDTADGILQTSVLVTGNGATTANLTVVVIEKP